MKRLFFDIETTPLVVYSWRIGYKINLPHDNIIEHNKIICICYKWENSKSTNSLIWDSKQCDKKMLVKFLNLIEQADECVAHNGDGYDIKWIRTRCAFHGLYCPDKINSYDTLKKARKQFRLNSNKLDYIAKFFGVGEKMQTGGFDLWVDVMKKDKIAMKKMVEYCKKDVVILEKVFKKIYEYSEVNTHIGVVYGDDKWTCPKCGSQRIRTNGTRILKSGNIRNRMRCKSCNAGWQVSNTVLRSFLEYQHDKKNNKN